MKRKASKKDEDEKLKDELKVLKNERKQLQKKNTRPRTRKNKVKKKNQEFNPDRLSLTKQDILEFCDAVLAKWNEDPLSNSKHIFAMNAVRTSVIWTDDESLKAIWNEILRWTFELLYKNAIAQAKEENASWSNTLEKLKTA